MRSTTSTVLMALTVAASLLGCGGSDSTGGSFDVSSGQVTLSLSSSGTDGTVYRLRNATLSVFGTSEQTIASEDYLDTDIAIVPLPVGSYSIVLQPYWRLENVADGSTVEARLTTPNPQSFVISDGVRTAVSFGFTTSAGPVQLGTGELAVSINVQQGSAGAPGTAGVPATAGASGGAAGVGEDSDAGVSIDSDASVEID